MAKVIEVKESGFFIVIYLFSKLIFRGIYSKDKYIVVKATESANLLP